LSQQQEIYLQQDLLIVILMNKFSNIRGRE
jgi:hypothetical protein